MAVRELEFAQPVVNSVVPGGWHYYEIDVTTTLGALLVTLERNLGDPVLFVKHIDEGYVQGGVPTISDYTKYADVDSFRSRQNFHYHLSK
eukprot:gene27710-34206_t